MKKIVVIPIFNEEEQLVNVLNDLQHFDVLILINDGSTDNTDAIINNWIENRSNVYYLKFDQNKKMAPALKAGFGFVNYLIQRDVVSNSDVVITIDADGQHKTEYINKMVDYMDKNSFDIVIAMRDFSQYPLFKILGNRLLTAFASVLSGFKFNDVESGMRVIAAGRVQGILEFYTGRGYSCAQEIGIISALLNYKVCNKFHTEITYYRSRTTIIDAAVNVCLGGLAFLRFKLGLKNDAICSSKEILLYEKAFSRRPYTPMGDC